LVRVVWSPANWFHWEDWSTWPTFQWIYTFWTESYLFCSEILTRGLDW
jgi:hypothetical protein